MPTITTSEMTPTSTVLPWRSSSPTIQLPNFRQAFAPSMDVPVIFGSSPITTSIAAPKRDPAITAFDSSSEIQPILKMASSRNNNPVTRVIALTNSTASSPDTDASTTALPATAANAELGPVEICLAVPKSAYRIVPAAAAYKPCWIGTPAIPAYPSDLGTTSAATARPATRSPRSHERS